MHRIVMMCLRNLFLVPPAYIKLCHYAKHTDKYPELTKYRHIQYIFKRAVKSGNVDLQVFGTENIPTEGGFTMYSNHQGMFDVLAIPATCDQPLGAVLKKELKDMVTLSFLWMMLSFCVLLTCAVDHIFSMIWNFRQKKSETLMQN